MPQEHILFTYQAHDYLWNGTTWVDRATQKIPPKSIVQILNAELGRQGESIADSEVDPEAMVRKASLLREISPDVSEKILRRALAMHPNRLDIIVALAAILRSRHRPESALELTQSLLNQRSTPLFTTRAAAWCDLGEWEKAKKEVARALAIGPSEQAFAVVRRIKHARPELYPGSNKD
jgi:tetratricopeptide (TPR) repeat protein